MLIWNDNLLEISRIEKQLNEMVDLPRIYGIHAKVSTFALSEVNRIRS